MQEVLHEHSGGPSFAEGPTQDMLDKCNSKPEKNVVPSTEINWANPPVGPDGEPIWVDVRINVYRICSVDSVRGSFNMKIGMFCYWTDPRLCGHEAELPGKLWAPRFRLTNSLPDVTEVNVSFALQDPAKGRVMRCRIYEGEVLCTLRNLNDFPFDINCFHVQFCTISDYMTLDESQHGTQLKGKTYRIREIREEGEGKWLRLLWDGSILEWNFLGMSTAIEECPPDPGAGYEQSYVHIGVHLSRNSKYYFFKVIVPLWFIGMSTGAALAFDFEALPERFAHISTNLLAIFALFFVVGASLPKVDFLTAIDELILALLAIMAMGGMCTIPIATYAKRGDEQTAGNINMALGCFSIVLFIGANMYSFGPAFVAKQRKLAKLAESGGGDEAEVANLTEAPVRYSTTQELEATGALSRRSR